MNLLLLAAIVSAAVVDSSKSLVENCSNPQSLWDKHYCGVVGNPVKYQKECFPYRRIPNATVENSNQFRPKSIRGVVVFNHGFTACPNHHWDSAAYMQSLGYVVMVPLIVGQGVKAGFNCTGTNNCIGDNNDNPTDIANSINDYVEWVNHVNEMTRELVKLIPTKARSSDFSVISIGLSFGSALSLFAASRPQTPITKLLIVNGYFQTSIPELDFLVHDCRNAQDPKKCVAALIDNPAAGDPKIPAYGESSTGKIRPVISAVKSLTSRIKLALVRFFGPIFINSFSDNINFFWSSINIRHFVG